MSSGGGTSEQDPWADARAAADECGLTLDEILHAVTDRQVRIRVDEEGRLEVHQDDVRRLAGLHRLAESVFDHSGPTDENEGDGPPRR